MAELTVQTSGARIHLSARAEGATLRACEQDGVAFVRVEVPPGEGSATLTWDTPLVDTHAFWHPGLDRNQTLTWARSFEASAVSQAPVGCLYSLAGQNRLTFALSEVLQPVTVHAGVHEETASFRVALALHAPAGASYTLRLDARDVPFAESVQDVSRWWASLPGLAPAPVPAAAREPVVSTWYSFHQDLSAAALERECARAKEIGCEAVIVDDGWQTSDKGRGYAYCGDWEPAPEKIPDMRAFVARVQSLGMKYLLWYAVPFVGTKSRVWERFKDKLLYLDARLAAGVLDPRFPEVRAYLVETLARPVREWGVDGLKLDFIDKFQPDARRGEERGEGRDHASVPEAVDRLLSELTGALKGVKPEVMLEFRQTYVGPAMRAHAHMFRAADCPNDAVQNRVRTIDLQLLSGDTAVHADMVMWHPEEPVESAALGLWNTLFAVPQLSVRLDTLPAEHLEMLRFYLSFWRAHRDVLLGGALSPSPDPLYPLVVATTGAKRVAAVYGDALLNPGPDLPPELYLVNGTRTGRVVLELPQPTGPRVFEAYDCRAALVTRLPMSLSPGVHALAVPAGGVARLSAHQPLESVKG